MLSVNTCTGVVRVTGGRDGGRKGKREDSREIVHHLIIARSLTSLPPPLFPFLPPSLVSQHHLRMSDGIFITIKGTLPRVSSGLFGGKAPVADVDAYDVRYLSYT